MSILVQLHTMNEIRNYQQKTYVTLKDWRVLTTDSTPEQIYNWINNHSHIMIDWEMHSKFSIQDARVVDMDDMESLILAQSKEIQDKIREKRKWLKEERGTDMTMSYLRNYLSQLTD